MFSHYITAVSGFIVGGLFIGVLAKLNHRPDYEGAASKAAWSTMQLCLATHDSRGLEAYQMRRVVSNCLFDAQVAGIRSISYAR